MALDFSLGISWQFGLLFILSILLLPFFRSRYAFIVGALTYSLVDILPALFGVHGTIGLWTLTGAITWGIIGFLFSNQKPNGSPFTFAKLGLGGTLIFDAVTGVVLSPLIWGMPFQDALIGQIPFTIKHLLGIGVISVVLAPLLFPSINNWVSTRAWWILKPQINTANR